jgi:predicted 2-oxoglutarate/Fe(II)-dependent dioxygenase YbiX
LATERKVSRSTAATPEFLTMNLRDSVLIQRSAIDLANLELLMDHVQRAQMTDSLVSNFAESGADDALEWVVNTQIRNTQQVHIPSSIAETLSSIDDANVLAFINPFFQVEVRDREPWQILHYGVGGHYIPHVDAETLYKDDAGLDLWEKTLDRDLSVVYFLNDDFEGGELVFPTLDLVIEPEPGKLVCFPSDHHYVHGVQPVTSGHRYTIVTWMRVNGTPALDEINQMAMDEYNSSWPKQLEQPPRLAKGGGIKWRR